MSAWEGSEWECNQEAAKKNPNKSSDITLSRRVDELVECHGSLRDVGEILGIDHAYLSRLRSGEKTEPSEEVLKKLGLERHVFYRRKRNGL